MIGNDLFMFSSFFHLLRAWNFAWAVRRVFLEQWTLTPSVHLVHTPGFREYRVTYYTPANKVIGYTDFTLSVRLSTILSSFQHCYETLEICILSGIYVLTKIVEIDYVKTVSCCLQLLINDLQDWYETQWNGRWRCAYLQGTYVLDIVFQKCLVYPP